MPGDYYTEEDALGPRSPGLQPVIVDAKPQEEPPPIVTQIFVSPPSRHSNKSKRRKHRPTQGDWVLIREMDPNRPDIAHAVSQEALNSGSETEHSSSDEEMQEASTKEMPAPAPGSRSDSLAAANNDFNQNALLGERRESHASHASSNGSALQSVISNTSTNTSVNGSTYTPSYPPANGDQLESLTNLRLSSPARDHLGTKLPSIQTQPPPSSAASPDSAASPNQLPSITQFDELVRSATNESEPGAIFAHRQSISSSGQSPSAPFRSLSISSHHSPAAQSPFPPFNASSPASAGPDPSRGGDVFLRQRDHMALFGPGTNRRPSQIADTTLRSASVVEYNSPVGYSADTLQAAIEGGRQRVLSIDGALASRQLPPPIGSGIQIQQNITGSYKCDTPGCTAAPFQTQYLLKYAQMFEPLRICANLHPAHT
jgi:hypothetical protein